MREPTAETVRPQNVSPAELVLEYRLEEQVALEFAPDVSIAYRHVERWGVSVFVDRSTPGEGRVDAGYAKLFVFNLEPGADIGDLADRASGTWIDVDTGRVQPAPRNEPDDDDATRDSHVLLLDRVWLHPDYRGQGLGPIVAAAVIERLGRGCHLAACYPAPFEDLSPNPDDRERAIQALGELWSKVGFNHWRDGVWMLDLEASDTHAALASLLAERSARMAAR